MNQSTQRNHASFRAVQNPTTKAVVSAGLAVVLVPLTAFFVVAHPAMSVSTALLAVLTYGVLTADRTRQYLHSLRGELTHRPRRGEKSAYVDDTDVSFHEDTA
jgi:L-asparagine transporter-like permease